MGNEQKEHHAAAPMIAGIMGGAVSTVSLFPLDLIKVRFQANEDPGYRTKGFRRRTMLRTMGQVIRHEGVVGLYQGLAPALIGSAASWGGYFFLYEGIKKELLHLKHKASPHDQTEHKLGASENFGAACSAGAVMVLLTNPVWLIKTRMQLQMKNVMKEREREGLSMKRPYNNMWDAAKTIVREEGPLALYKGAIPALMLVSHGGIQFVAYEFLKNHFGTYTREARTQADNDGSKRNNVIERLEDSIGYLTMGAVSKVMASSTTYPLQVIKTRLQQRSEAIEISEAGEVRVVKREYAGVMDCAKRIWQREGITGFFKGNIPNAIRVAPSAAITFVVYETIMDILRDKKTFQ